MAANAIPTPELNINKAKRADESCSHVTLKQRFEKLLREVFEGREEYLGVTPDWYARFGSGLHIRGRQRFALVMSAPKETSGPRENHALRSRGMALVQLVAWLIA